MSIRILKLENSHAFAKLAGKSQVVIAGSKQKDFYRNRQTHSYEVKSIAEIIAKNIGFEDISAVGIVSLAHDLGHPSFGHRGAKILNKISKEFGIPEGFSDNNNNISIIENNDLEFSRYELVSLIKYPDKLYPEQKKLYIPILNRYVLEESKVWGSKLKRTVACNIMDIADEIAYSTSDAFDSFAIGFVNKKLINFFKEQSQLFESNSFYRATLMSCADSVKQNNKRALRNYLLDLKIYLANDLFWDYEKANLFFRHYESKELIHNLVKFNLDNYVHGAKNVKKRDKAAIKFEKFAKYFFNCEPKDFLSDLYRAKYEYAKTDLDKLRVRRDMIADTSDQFVLSFKEG